MKLVVHDACVLIDLIEGSLLYAWPDLELVPLTTSLVLNEITDPRQKDALSSKRSKMKLVVEDLPGEELAKVIALQQQIGKGLSISDCSAIHQALKHSAILLTGDGKLRKTAKHHGLEAHGTLWILDTLIQRSLITPKVAAQKLRAIQASGSRLPSNECDARLHAWGATTGDIHS